MIFKVLSDFAWPKWLVKQSRQIHFPSIFGHKYLLGAFPWHERALCSLLFPVVVTVAFVALKSLELNRDLEVLSSLKALPN